MMGNKLVEAINQGRTMHVGVEGANFMHLLIKKTADDPRFNRICFWDYVTESSRKNIDDWLKMMNMNMDRGICGLGVICDIDKLGDNPRSSRIQGVAAAFKNSFNIDVEENIFVCVNELYLGFHVTPTYHNTGCLETSLLEHVNSEYLECAEKFCKCVTEKRSVSENKKHKIQVRALMSAKEPDMLFSDTANTNLWDWEQGSLNEMLKFLEVMNQLEAPTSHTPKAN